MYKNTNATLKVYAFNRNTSQPVLGDADNITCKVSVNGGARTALNDTNPVELEDGYYLFDVQQSENNGTTADFFPESSTANVQVIPIEHARYTRDTLQSLSTTVSQAILSELVSRFQISTSTSGSVQAITPVVTREERQSLGPFYVADFNQYLKTDNEIVITIHPSAKNATGRLVWTAKPTVAGAQNTIAVQVDSSSGLVTPTGGSIVAGDGSIVGLVNGTDPVRQVRLTMKARGLSTIAAGRFYWDLRRYDTSPNAVWQLAAGVIDFATPVNQAIA
jgi:hypothetical protein